MADTTDTSRQPVEGEDHTSSSTSPHHQSSPRASHGATISVPHAHGLVLPEAAHVTDPPSERPLPSPPRPPRLSTSQVDAEDAHEGSLKTEAEGTKERGDSLRNSPFQRHPDRPREHASLSDGPQHPVPLYLAATATFRGAEEDAQAEAEAAEATAAPTAVTAATTPEFAEFRSGAETPQTPLGVSVAVSSHAGSSSHSGLLSPSPNAAAAKGGADANAVSLLSADDPAEGSARSKRGGSKDFYAEEAEDFATMYKTAGLIPPDLDELEDEVLLGRSLSPALLIAKQRELSQQSVASMVPPASTSPPPAPTSTPHDAAPAPAPATTTTATTPNAETTTIGPHSQGHFTSSSLPRFAVHTTAPFAGPAAPRTGSEAPAYPIPPPPPAVRAGLRSAGASHTTYYPYQHGTPMPVFVGGGGGGGVSGGSASRQGSATHSMAASAVSATGFHDNTTTAGPGTSGAGASKHAHRHRHRRHHHSHTGSDRQSSHSSPVSDQPDPSRADKKKSKKHRKKHRPQSAHPASATLPGAPSPFPQRGSGHDDGDADTIERTRRELSRIPDSPILPEPVYRYAQSTVQPNDRAPRFPRDFGYLATGDDDDVRSYTSDATSATTVTPASTAITPTGTTPTSKGTSSSHPVDRRDVVYSLAPSTRASSGRVTPAVDPMASAMSADSTPLRLGFAHSNSNDVNRAGEGQPQPQQQPQQPQQTTAVAGVAAQVRPLSQVSATAVPAIARANTAPNIAQEESQRQLQEALNALGLCLRPSTHAPPLAQSHRLPVDEERTDVRDVTTASTTAAGVRPWAGLHTNTTVPVAPVAAAAADSTAAAAARRTSVPHVSAHPLAQGLVDTDSPRPEPQQPEGTLSTPVASQQAQQDFPAIASPGPAFDAARASSVAGTFMGAPMATFEPQFLGSPMQYRRSNTVPAVNALLIPGSGATGAAPGTTSAFADGGMSAVQKPGGGPSFVGAPQASSVANSFNPSMSFNPVRNASFLLNASFGQLANFSIVRDGSASGSRLSQQNRDALVKELEKRRARVVKQLAQQQREATMGNVFALVRGSNTWQLQYLLQEGLVDVNERDYNGCTPLHVAALEGNQAIARILLSYGADIVAVDRFGRTPLDCAAVNRHGSVGRYLLAVIRNKQQQQHSYSTSMPGHGDANMSAAVADGEDSMPPTPFGVSAPTTTAGGDVAISSSMTNSTAPATNASTMPDVNVRTGNTSLAGPTGSSPVHTTATTPSQRPPTGPAESSDQARLLVPGAELVGRKQEKTLRNRARLDTLTGVVDLAGLTSPTEVPPLSEELVGGNQMASHTSSVATNVIRHAMAREDEDDAVLRTRDRTSATVTTAPNTPWATAPTAGPGSSANSYGDGMTTPPVETASTSASSVPRAGSSATSALNKSRTKQLTAGVSRGRSRRNRGPRQSTLFTEEEDKFLEEQEEQIADEVAVSAAAGIGSPVFYMPTSAPPSSAAPANAMNAAASATAAAAPSETAEATAPDAATPSPKSAHVVDGTSSTTATTTTAGTATSMVVAADVKAGAARAEALDKREETAHSAEDAATADGSSAPRFSIFTTISDTVSLIVCMCGLPGRGKSFISKRLVRYINWKGVPCRVFNAGNYRRQLLGVAGTADAAFFDPNNPQGKELRERMAELACEDLVRFIASHVLAVGILDATNTTKARRLRLKHFFENECSKFGLSYRLLFIESVCTDETIITENILRSKCDNDDFKDVQDTSEVIAEFRDRIHQYEKVYETLEPSEELPFIKIINVKHHVIIHKVDSGLGSRIAFFLQNLHPVAYPIYIVMAGETYGDQQGVFGGDERLTERGEEFAQALRQFIQDRYVPNMVVLHATNPCVLSTIRPLMEGAGSNPVPSGSAYGHSSPNGSGPATTTTPTGTGRAAAAAAVVVVAKDASAPSAPSAAAAATATATSLPSSKVASPVNSVGTTSTGGRGSRQQSPAVRSPAHYVFPTELPPRKLHKTATDPEELARLAGGDLRAIARRSPESSSSSSSSSCSSSSSEEEDGAVAGNAQGVTGAQDRAKDGDGNDPFASGHGGSTSSSSSSYTGSSSGSGSSSDDDEDDAEEVLCPVPGLDNINFGRFSGHSAGWVREKYPRLSTLLYVSAMQDEARNEAAMAKSSHQSSPTTTTTTTAAAAAGAGSAAATATTASTAVVSPTEREGVSHASNAIPPPCSAKLKEGGLNWFRHAASHMDPLLAYCVQFPNGESCRQVNARLEPALMAVMRTQSPVFVVAPAVPAQGMLAFFADVIPELSPTLRVPRHCVVELGVKDEVTVHPLVPGAGVNCPASPLSPLMDDHEIQEALKMATTMAANRAEAEAERGA